MVKVFKPISNVNNPSVELNANVLDKYNISFFEYLTLLGKRLTIGFTGNGSYVVPDGQVLLVTNVFMFLSFAPNTDVEASFGIRTGATNDGRFFYVYTDSGTFLQRNTITQSRSYNIPIIIYEKETIYSSISWATSGDLTFQLEGILVDKELIAQVFR